MAQLTIGRAFDGLDVAPSSVQANGRTLTMEGPIICTSMGLLRSSVDRFNALLNDDETVVPLTFTVDPGLDGFYRVLGANASLASESASVYYGRWQVDLERVGGGSLPQHEISSTYTHIVNGFSASLANINGATDVVISACPDDAYDAWNGATAAEGDARVSETGTMATFNRTTSIPFSTLHRWSVTPDDAYIGACSLRGTYAGISNQLCLGDMAPAVNGLVLSNGLVRAKMTAGVLTVEVYDSGAWVTTSATGWTFQGGSGTIGTQTPDLDAAPYVSVLRNSPEAVSIRLICASTGPTSPAGRMWLDLGVKRGSMVITVNPRDDYGLAWLVKSTNAVAGTNINGGVRQTSNDGNGNRLIVVGTGSVRDTTNIGVSTPPFGIGVELGGSGATGSAAAQKVAYEWFVGRTEAQRVVRR